MMMKTIYSPAPAPAPAAYRVDTTSRLAQWRIIHTFPSFTFNQSHPFTIGNWNWHLSVEKSPALVIRLYPEKSKENQPPVASFIIKLIWPSGARKCLIHPEVTDKLLKSNDDFVWKIEAPPLTGKFIIDVEFLDLKTTSEGDAGNQPPCSIWKQGFTTTTTTRRRRQSSGSALSLLNRMLSQSIHTDIQINASNGRLSAHKTVLASRSPVFRSMFTHRIPTINISELSVEACKALLNYMYGNISKEEFLAHRLSLVHAAHTYEIPDLKEATHESLVEDIDTTNVLERLQCATLYQLPKLKTSCMLYLVKFARIFDIVGDDLKAFVKCADRELVSEIFDQLLGSWKGF